MPEISKMGGSGNPDFKYLVFNLTFLSPCWNVGRESVQGFFFFICAGAGNGPSNRLQPNCPAPQILFEQNLNFTNLPELQAPRVSCVLPASTRIGRTSGARSASAATATVTRTPVTRVLGPAAPTCRLSSTDPTPRQCTC